MPIHTSKTYPIPMEAQSKPTLSRKSSSSSSFRLRSPSLNSLRLRRIFDLFDKNGDGMITVQDLSQALALLGLDADFSELESTIRSHVRPGNDGLGFDDFVSLHQSLDQAFFSNDEQNVENGQDEMSQEESDLRKLSRCLMRTFTHVDHMETKSIECRDPELEQSFSFSGCCDFKSSSSLAIFSDINQSEDDDDNESYIEIVLEPSRVGFDGGGGSREEEDDCDDEMELRISLSSGVLLPVETKTSDLYKSVNSCASSLSSSSSSAFTFSSSSTGQKVSGINRESSEIGLGDGRPPDANRLDFLASSNSTRKPSKITTTKINSGMMMKFFIKFRALKLGTLLASFLKASQAKSSTDKVKTREESTLWTYNQSLMDKGSLQERKQGEIKSVGTELGCN
ncbi:hypothetical protein GH714_019581 [Hevea brasiliensis]|uniref:EF-hand domain-containing protein n=1 Tax=Hevea brasiliensis TaxID=3981 RepID=A0A6A6LYP8_HEVBR|nr:hypothetical protein GH714_019581 [Hevea brasiliensis]